jgi:hypothetical protein
MKQNQEEINIALKVYHSPRLTIFGLVEDLTGGESGNDWDLGGSHDPGK